MKLAEQRGGELLPWSITISERQVLLACLAVDGKQVVHECNDALQLRVGRLGFGLHLDGVDKSPSGMCETAGVDHIFRADVFFVHHVPIGVEDSAVVLEELCGDRFTARHLEVEDHTFARHRVLPEICLVKLALFVRRLYAYVRLVCAVPMHGFLAGANPARQLSLQPVAIGATVKVTKRLKPSMERVIE